MRREEQEVWGGMRSLESLASKLAKRGHGELGRFRARVWSASRERLGGRRTAQRLGLR